MLSFLECLCRILEINFEMEKLVVECGLGGLEGLRVVVKGRVAGAAAGAAMLNLESVNIQRWMRHAKKGL